MKMVKMLVMFLLMATVARAADWTSYVEAQAGSSFLGDNAKAGALEGIRFGLTNNRNEFGLAYQRSDSQISGERLMPGYLTLNTVALDFRNIQNLPYGFSAKWGLSVGYSVPLTDSRYAETIDAGVSALYSLGINYKVTEHLSAGVTANYLMFHADSHRTDIVTENDTVYSDGTPIGTVQTETPKFSDNSLNFNSVQIVAGAEYKF